MPLHQKCSQHRDTRPRLGRSAIRMMGLMACTLLIALTTGCATARFSNLVVVDFGNRGPGSLHDVRVSSGDCVWALRRLDVSPPGSASGITPYCNPGKVLTIQWTNDSGIRRRHDLTITSPDNLMVRGWNLEFKDDQLTVTQKEAEGPEIYNIRSTRRIFP